jgi:mannose-1-phosphate guanylyltransferase / phosphomannomutase
MQAVVMAGGEGSRLRPLTSTRPKPLVPVVNRPILWHVLRLLRRHGITESHITLHYLADQVTTAISAFGDLGLSINYSFEDKPLGTAGSVKLLEKELKQSFMVISGDVMTDFDLSELIGFHKKTGATVTIGLARVQNPLEYGVVLTDEQGRVTKFLEKPGWGEVFSDTVNSGIYIIEPEVLNLVDADRPFDFSKELFPRLLRAGEPIYAKALDGYWCDVGMPSQYLGAHHDILSGKTKVEIPGNQVSDKVWLEEGAEIKSGAELIPPCLIGSRSTIGRNAQVGPLTCIGSDVTVEPSAVVSRSVVYDFAYLGRESESKGCVLGKNAVLRPRSRVFEGAVIGDGTQLGSGSEVAQGIRIWPEKTIESGASVRTNLVWGLAWQRSIFGSRGIVGISNVEITPEITAKMGAAFATFAGAKSKIVAARDTLRSSRMLKRSFIAGLLSAGSTVFNLEADPLPLVRLAVTSNKLEGGVYFSSNPFEPDYSILQFLDSKGYNISKDSQKKIENILFKEEIHRSSSEELSDIYYLPQAADTYEDVVLANVDSKVITTARPRVVVDCGLGPASATAPQILSKLGCEVVSLNASAGTHSTTLSVAASPSNLKEIVTAVGAVAGFRFNGPGDTLRIVDEMGEMLSGDESLALMVEVMMRLQPGPIAVHLSSSSLIESIAEKNGQKVTRLKTEPRALMEAVGSKMAMFAGNDAGEFITSSELPFPDGLLAAAKIVEYLARTDAKINRIKKEIYKPLTARGVVMVPWNERGRIMRRLATDYGEKRVESLEGVKLMIGEGWVLINPSTDEPVFEITAESVNPQEAAEILRDFQARLSEIANGNEAVS